MVTQVRINWPWRKPSPANEIAQLLSEDRNKEDLLGVSNVSMPSPDKIRNDAARLVSYSRRAEYKIFADEAWSRVIAHLDKILDERSSNESRQYHCGALKSTLDLLRLSYQAQIVMKQHDSERSASLPR